MIDLIALAQIGGFAFAAGIVSIIAVKGFSAWRNGDLISRPVWERTEARADTLTTQLDRNTDAIVAQTATMTRGVAAQERQAKALEAQAAALAKLAARLPEP